MEQQKGFLGRLFDFSFDEFITPTIIRLLFGLSIALSVVYIISMIWGAFVTSFGYGIVTLVLSPLLLLLFVIIARVYLEIIIILFRIASDVRDLVDKGPKDL
ncbi:MAG: DUF4282 domain-containing protein [Chloroflexota bacterium]|nr:DUF4282 domain-containing protein [Chloroflexota bacterium]